MGIDDATREIVGVTSVKYATDNLIQAARNCSPPIAFDPPKPEVVIVDSRRLVVAYVPPSPTPVRAGGVFWQRQGTFTVPMILPEISARLYSRNLLSWERQPAAPPATLD